MGIFAHPRMYLFMLLQTHGAQANTPMFLPKKKYACERERAYAVATANDHK